MFWCWSDARMSQGAAWVRTEGTLASLNREGCLLESRVSNALCRLKGTKESSVWASRKDSHWATYRPRMLPSLPWLASCRVKGCLWSWEAGTVRADSRTKKYQDSQNDAHVLPHCSHISVLHSILAQGHLFGTEIPPGTQVKGAGNHSHWFFRLRSPGRRIRSLERTLWASPLHWLQSHLLLFTPLGASSNPIDLISSMCDDCQIFISSLDLSLEWASDRHISFSISIWMSTIHFKIAKILLICQPAFHISYLTYKKQPHKTL